MNRTGKQRGMSFISALFMLALLGFVAVFVIRLVPPYVEYFGVRAVLSSFSTDTTQYPTAASVKDAVEKRFGINNVSSVQPEDVLVEPTAGGYDLRVDYEVRVPFVSNVSLVVKFTGEGRAQGGSATP